MDNIEIESVIDKMLGHARHDHETRREGLRAWKELDRLLDDPGLIDSREMALGVCGLLLRLCIEKGGMVEGSIMHRLGLRLMDYIRRDRKADGRGHGTGV